MPGLLELPVVLHGGGGDVHVDAADGAVFVVDAVDGVDAVEDVLDGVVDRVLARFHGQTLVAHILQGDDLAGRLSSWVSFLRVMCLFFSVIGAVDAAVDAVIGQIQRREHDDAVAVELVLDAVGQPVQGLYSCPAAHRPAGRRLPGGSGLCRVRLWQGCCR